MVGSGGVGDPNFLPISFSWVELRLHNEFQLPRLPRSSRFMVGGKTQVSIKLISPLAPDRAEGEAGVVAKADK